MSDHSTVLAGLLRLAEIFGEVAIQPAYDDRGQMTGAFRLLVGEESEGRDDLLARLGQGLQCDWSAEADHG